MRGKKSACWLMAFLLLLLAGCVAPPSPPVLPGAEEDDSESGGARLLASHEPAGEPPRLIGRILQRTSPTLDAVVDGVTTLTLEPGRVEMAVGSGDVLLSWQLETHDAAAYRDLIRTRGAEPDRVRTVMGAIQAHFSAPLPARWEAWLDGVDGSRTVLVRQPEPSVAIGYRTEDGRRIPIEGTEAALPAGPLVLELQFDQPIDRQSLEAWRAGLQVSVGQVVTARWAAGNRWTVELDEVPTRLELDLRRLVAADTGLPVNRSPLTLWAEASLPFLERVNLSTGGSERLLALPPDISEALPAPGGRWIALRGWELRDGGMDLSRVEVVDLAKNRMVRAPLRGWELHWAGGRLVNLNPLGAEGPGWEAWDPEAGAAAAQGEDAFRMAAFSPDGRLAAYLGESAPDEASDFQAPVWNPLVLRDVRTGASQTVERFVRGWLFGKDGDFTQWLAWSPDGGRIAALDPVERFGASDLVVYDLEREERRVVRQALPVSPWGYRLSWSPDGEHLLAVGSQEVTLIPLDESPVIQLEDSLHGQAFWDETGRRLLAARAPWTGVFVYDLADGSRIELGDGLPAGWSGDSVYIVRWPGADARYVPPQS